MLSHWKRGRSAEMKIIDLTDANFEDEVLKSQKPVLIDFWAEWCAPCRRLTPVIEELAGEYGERLLVAKVDVDANPSLAARFQVRSIPTLLFMHNGQVSESLVGPPASKAKLSQHIDQLIGS